MFHFFSFLYNFCTCQCASTFFGVEGGLHSGQSSPSEESELEESESELLELPELEELDELSSSSACGMFMGS